MPRFARLVALAVLTASFAGPLPTRTAGSSPARPNVLIILTDDQRPFDTLGVLPKTLQWFQAGGTTYPNAFAVTPLCCPARATIMTGRYAHNTLVKTNQDQELLNHDTTLQKYLNDAGYRTAVIGKFLNGWPVQTGVPPYWDRYNIMQPEYYDTPWNNNGNVMVESEYSTDVVAQRALNYIENFFASADTEPWFLYLAPFAPHGPWTCEGTKAADEDDYCDDDVGTWDGNPAVLEGDKSDKPQYVKNAKNTLDDGRSDRQGQLRALLSVDDMVDDVFQALQAEGELEDTLAFFLSDNGFFWSDHGLTAKNQPYLQAMEVPFMVRWPAGGILAGATDSRFVGNVDIAPTVMDATDVTPVVPMDGRSLLDPAARKKMLSEAWATGSRGPWATITTPKYLYTEYYTDDFSAVDFREYYALQDDPWQLQNLLGDGKPRNDPYLGPLQRELLKARTCVGGGGKPGCHTALDAKTVRMRCPGARGANGHHMVGSEVKEGIRGIAGRDVICGLDRRDTLRGKGGKDLLLGGDGADALWGGPGPDTLEGGGGPDVCRGGPGRDRFVSCERERG